MAAKKKYKQVVLEGVTCTGKTSVGKRLPALLGESWIYDKSVLSDTPRGKSIRKLVDEGVEPMVNQTLWLSDVMLHEYEVGILLESKNLIRDRSYRSFFSFERFYRGPSSGERESILSFEPLVESISLEPDLIILLTANKEDIMSRMNYKPDVSKIDRSLLDGDLIEKLEQDMIKTVEKCQKYCLINTSDYDSVEDVLSKVYKVINGALSL